MPKPRKPAGQVASFRIYPEPGLSRLHYRVRIFRTVADMHRYVRTRNGAKARPGRHCKGMCSCWTRLRQQGGRLKAQPDIGEIVYAKNWMGARILSHECAHAMFGWAHRRKVDVTDIGRGRFIGAGEERACGVLGDLVRQVSIQVWDRGLAK